MESILSSQRGLGERAENIFYIFERLAPFHTSYKWDQSDGDFMRKWSRWTSNSHGIGQKSATSPCGNSAKEPATASIESLIEKLKTNNNGDDQ